MARKITLKSVLYCLSGIISAILMSFCSMPSASATGDIDYGFRTYFKSASYSVGNGSYTVIPDGGVSGNINLTSGSNGGTIGAVNLVLTDTINYDSVITISYNICGNGVDSFKGFIPGGNFGIISQEFSRIGTNDTCILGFVQLFTAGSTNTVPLNTSNNLIWLGANYSVKLAGVSGYHLKGTPSQGQIDDLRTEMRTRLDDIIVQDKAINHRLDLIGDHIDTTNVYLYQILNKLDESTTAGVIDAINSQSAKEDERWAEQQKQREEDLKREEEQRKEDEKKAEDASSDSSQSSEDSQKEVDDASKNLFQILTDFVSAITGTSAGTCSISGDFGFFNAGNINLCTGAGKITPVTTVVGTIMLIGLIVPAVISLLHRFVALYNEVMS